MRLEVVLGCAALALGTSFTVRMGIPSPKTPSLHASDMQSAPKEHRPVLVELFTSEGCSSCPPADDLLRAIDGKYTDQGALIVGVSEHVTYWDHGGWKDPFDSEAITDRQNEYGQRFHLDSVYTPQMVVNGETQLVGSDAKALLQAVQKAENGATIGIVSAKMDGDAVDAVVSFAGELPKNGADMFAVVAQDETTEHVLRGENQGRTLKHASVARTLVKTTKILAHGETTVRLKLPGDLATAHGTRRHLIVWVQEPGLGRVLGVGTRAF